MATAQADGSEYVSIVLRVKRKRTTAEDGPPDALVVASKSMKLEQTEEASNSLENGGVFQWCGTYNGDVEITKSDKPLLDIVSKFNKKRSAISKISPFHKLTISDSKEQAKVEKKKSSAANRFKLLSSRRCLSDSRNEDKVNEGDRPLHLYEVIMDQDTLSKVKEENGSQMEGVSIPEAAASVAGVGDITCNSTVMKREKITPDDDDSDYVYDVYMSRHCNMETVSSFDWSTLSVYSQSSLLIHDIFESDDDDKFEDEDDSNDESNWRNDYPDEDEDESSAYSNSSDDSDHIHHSHYRHREPYYDELEFFGDSSGYYDNDNYEGGGADDYDTDDEEYV